MRILLADDDSVNRTILTALLARWGHQVEIAADGEAAWAALQAEAPPPFAVLDWFMPGIDGLELCRRIRAEPRLAGIYVIVVTTQHRKAEVVAGLDAGANDYIAKPFDHAELHARVQAGVRVVELQQQLAARVRELEAALAEVRQLREFLPICCYCKKIRDDRDYWQQLEHYFAERAHIRFSHGICPECYATRVKPDLDALGGARVHP